MFALVVVAAFHFHGSLVGCAVFLSLAAGHQNYKQNKDKQQLLTDLDKVGRARRKPDIQISTGLGGKGVNTRFRSRQGMAERA